MTKNRSQKSAARSLSKETGRSYTFSLSQVSASVPASANDLESLKTLIMSISTLDEIKADQLAQEILTPKPGDDVSVTRVVGLSIDQTDETKYTMNFQTNHTSGELETWEVNIQFGGIHSIFGYGSSYSKKSVSDHVRDQMEDERILLKMDLISDIYDSLKSRRDLPLTFVDDEPIIATGTSAAGFNGKPLSLAFGMTIEDVFKGRLLHVDFCSVVNVSDYATMNLTYAETREQVDPRKVQAVGKNWEEYFSQWGMIKERNPDPEMAPIVSWMKETCGEEVRESTIQSNDFVQWDGIIAALNEENFDQVLSPAGDPIPSWVIELLHSDAARSFISEATN